MRSPPRFREVESSLAVQEYWAILAWALALAWAQAWAQAQAQAQAVLGWSRSRPQAPAWAHRCRLPVWQGCWAAWELCVCVFARPA
jgi:hypothetical protein